VPKYPDRIANAPSATEVAARRNSISGRRAKNDVRFSSLQYYATAPGNMRQGPVSGQCRSMGPNVGIQIGAAPSKDRTRRCAPTTVLDSAPHWSYLSPVPSEPVIESGSRNPFVALQRGVVSPGGNWCRSWSRKSSPLRHALCSSRGGRRRRWLLAGARWSWRSCSSLPSGLLLKCSCLRVVPFGISTIIFPNWTRAISRFPPSIICRPIFSPTRRR